MNHSPEARPLTLADVDRAADVISQAFMDDPLCSFMLPLRLTRRRTLFKFFRAVGEVNIVNGRVFGVGEPLTGIAYWKFSDQDRISISVKSLGRFLPLLLTFYPLGYFRAKAVLTQIDLMHEKYAGEPHFYLDNIGVLESERGKGLASRLIRPFLDMADSQHVIAYTDTVTRSNVALYEHFGFKCMEEGHVPGTGDYGLGTAQTCTRGRFSFDARGGIGLNYQSRRASRSALIRR